MRRTLRIFPLYFAALLLVLLAAAAVGTFVPAVHRIWVPILFLQNMPILMENINRLPSPFPLFHFWSLAVEEQFYLIWPFLLVLQRTGHSAKHLCLGTFFAAFAFRILIWQLNPHADDYVEFLLTRAGELAAGGWLAIAYRGPEWRQVERFAPITAMIGLAGFFFAGLYGGSFEPRGPWIMELDLPCITLFFNSILAAAIRLGILQSFASASWLRWLGGISFGIYVFHVLLALFSTQLHSWLRAGAVLWSRTPYPSRLQHSDRSLLRGSRTAFTKNLFSI